MIVRSVASKPGRISSDDHFVQITAFGSIKLMPALRKFGVLLLSTLAPMDAASAASADNDQPSVELSVPFLPAAVVSDGRSLLMFEVRATNFQDANVDLLSLKVVNSGDGKAIADFAGTELTTRTRIVGNSSKSLTTRLQAGASAIVYVEISLPLSKGIPRLSLELQYAGDSGRTLLVSTLPDIADASGVPILGPPLLGGTWVAVHDPSWERGHRRVIYTLGGKARIPGRYAVDWVGVDDDGHTSRGEPDKPERTIGYNTPVLAGADAEVVDARDGMREATSIKGNPKHRIGDGAGNYVVLRLPGDYFAFYEHLRPGSIRVRRGDHVRLGQKIGSLGFTGDTTGPHLHLHVANCADPLACEGVPFKIQGMTEAGRYASLPDLGTKRWEASDARGQLQPEWPAVNIVVRFSPLS